MKKNYIRPTNDFSDFYARQNNAGSNVYFAASEDITKKNKNSTHTSKKRLFFGGMIGILSLILSFSVFTMMHLETNSSSFAAINSKAYANIFSGHRALAQFDVQKALFDFHAAYQRLLADNKQKNIFSFASLLHPENKTLLDTDQLFIQTGTALTKSAESLSKLSQAVIFQDDFSSYQSFSLGGVLKESLGNMENSQVILKHMQEKLKVFVQTDSTSFLYNKFQALIPQLSISAIELSKTMDYMHFATWMLGVDAPKRFLIVIQDTRRPWATGGRIGMYGVITTKDGMVKDMTFDNVNNLDGALNVKIIPPRPIQKVTTSWGMSFSNWFFDDALSIEKFEYFYKKSGGLVLDGVIVVNDIMLQNILDIIGTYPLPNSELVTTSNISDMITGIDSEDFSNIAAREVMPLLLRTIAKLPQEKLRAIFNILQDAFLQKDMITKFSSSDYQAFSTQQEWKKKINQINDFDYTAIALFDMSSMVATQAPLQNIFKHIDIGEDGKIAGTLVTEILQTDDISRLLYVKTYLPKGTELVEVAGQIDEIVTSPIDYTASGFITDDDVAVSEASKYINKDFGTDIFEESGYTVFGNWVSLPAKKSVRLIYNYILPFTIDIGDIQSKFDVVFQKQPGSKIKLNFTVSLPTNKKFTKTPDNFTGEFLEDIRGDKIFTIIFE